MRHAMIMAGGSGTRLWPMSRPNQPKQLLPILPGGVTLLEAALDGITPLIESDSERWICTNESFCSQIHQTIGFRQDRLLAEPLGRDTLNAVGFAAAVISVEDSMDANVAILTADHLIQPNDKFVRGMQTGFDLVESDPDRLVTFSIPPTRPAIEYGYIERGKPIAPFPNAFEVKRYVEKPERANAQEYAKTHGFGWSSGLFVFSVRTILSAIKKFQPASYEGLMQIRDTWGTDRQHNIIKTVYPDLPRTSIDYGVMEPASIDSAFSVATVQLEVDWIDVGSWSSFAQLLPDAGSGNKAMSPAIRFQNSSNSIVVSDQPDHTIALVGCDEMIVVHTKDATLVCPKNREQDIKAFAEDLGE